MAKRLFDLIGSALGLAVAAPLLLLLVWLVRRDSPGPGIFRQVRVGREGREFVCYKLRTMRTGTVNAPTHEIGAAEITRLGRVLRASKLDELPQLYNVLKGEMSLVGPRPCLPSQQQLISARAARGVLGCRPGITGLAQIRDIDMSDPERLAAADGEYCAASSLRFDLQILLATLAGSGMNSDRVAGLHEGRRRTNGVGK